MSDQKKSYRVILGDQTDEDSSKAWDHTTGKYDPPFHQATVFVRATNPKEAEQLVRDHVAVTPPLQTYPIKKVEVRENTLPEWLTHIN